jgi:hypothetical protein
MSWWEAIEDHVAERERDAPDPWADRPLGGGGLTEAQEDFLAGLADQPRPGRLADEGPHAAGEREGTPPPGGAVETGNSPGDEEVPPGVPSSS